MALYAQEGTMGQLFPSSTCQSPPSIVYSTSLSQVNHRPPATQPGSGQMYPLPDYRSMVPSPYPYWPSEPPMPPSQPPYPHYPPTGLSTNPLHPDSTLLPQPISSNRPARSQSGSSSGGLGIPSNPPSDRSPPSLSRSLSPSSPDLRAYGYPNKNGTWSCAYSGCTSRAVFTRGCDLRKHYKRHTKSFFCRHEGCPQSTGGGFSSKKDLARHEAKHNPGVLCDWEGCDRVFSRVDNMV